LVFRLVKGVCFALIIGQVFAVITIRDEEIEYLVNEFLADPDNIALIEFGILNKEHFT